jgi:hypothetical protein
MLSYDSWISTHERPTLSPVVKFLYWESDEKTEEWASRTGAEWIGIPSQQVCKETVNKLKKSTKWLPQTMRKLFDGSTVGFLYW